MNTRLEYEDEQMRKYLTNELIEKAPDGFTDKMMSIISVEAAPVKVSHNKMRRNLVPVISILVTLFLTVMVIILPASGVQIPSPAWLKLAGNFTMHHSDRALDSLLNFNLPAYLPYLFISILFLTIFDKGLSGLFHRWKSDGSHKNNI